MDRGFVRIGSLRGVTLRVHWSAALGALFVSRFTLAPVIWLGFAVLLLAHELGHAFLVRRLGHEVLSVDFAALGGVCRWRGSAANWERAWIAWGGVLAQLLVYLLVQVVVWATGAPQSAIGFQLASIFLEVNLWLIAINLLPIPPLDGALAWRLPQELRAAGVSPKRLLLGPLFGWVRRRRSARSGAESGASRWRRRGSGPSSQPADDQGDVAPPQQNPVPPRDAEPEPSAQAQRELAALLERISREAGEARKKTKK